MCNQIRSFFRSGFFIPVFIKNSIHEGGSCNEKAHQAAEGSMGADAGGEVKTDLPGFPVWQGKASFEANTAKKRKERNDAMSLGYEFAEIIQREYEKGNTMAYFALIRGIGSCMLELKPGTGHNHWAVVEGIHEYHDSRMKKRKLSIRQGYEEGLMRSVELIFSIEEAENNLRIICAELKYEKEHPKTFSINADHIFALFRQSIQEHYLTITQKCGKDYFDNWLKDRNEYLSKTYGYII